MPLSFYAPPQNIVNGMVQLRGAEVRHVVKVMRKGPGDTIKFVDGMGTEYLARISEVKKDRLIGEVMESRPSDAEPKTRVTLAPGLIKGQRMDFLIEKATELGAHEFWPVICERSVRRLNRAKDRWQKVALSALKQCGRAYLPRVLDPIKFEDVIKRRQKFAYGLVADPRARRTLKDIKVSESVIVLLGPEGGFTEEELETAERAGFIPFSMGKRILRADTASIVALAMILKDNEEI